MWQITCHVIFRTLRLGHSPVMSSQHDLHGARCPCVACNRSSSGLWLGMTGCAALMVIAAALGFA